MGIWLRIKTVVSNLLRKQSLETDLDAEIRDYAEAVADEKIRSGMSPSEARRAALAEMGGMEQVKQAVRETRSGTTIESLWQDVHYGLRVLRRNPSFTLTAIITLGLGIGATTSIFSAVYSLLLRPLPYSSSDQLVSVTAQTPKFKLDVLISPDFVSAQHAVKSFSQLAGYWWANRNLTGSGDPVRIVWAGVTANFLPMLGVTPQLGRNFAENEDRPGGPPLVLLSNRIWLSQFQADPHIVGKSVSIDGKAETVIGVLPANFTFPNYGLEPDVYAPADLSPDTSVSPEKPVMGIFTIARLRPGVTAEHAQAEMQTFFEDRGRGYPPGFDFLSSGRQAAVGSLQRHLTGDDRRPLWILLAAVAGVLLIACSNVANLQLARAVSSRHETAVRGALGASRFRLLRKSLVESFVLSLFAAVLGLGIALLITVLIHRVGQTTADATISYGGESLQLPFGKLSTVIHINGWVLAFTAGLALLATLLSGVVPAVNGARTDLRNVLQTAALRVTSSREQRFFRQSLLVLQISLAVMLLAAAGLLVHSFVNVLQYGSGFDPNNVVTGKTLLTGSRYQSADARRRFVKELMPRLQALPQVNAAALASSLPLAHVDGGPVSFDDNPNPPVAQRKVVTIIAVTPDYFRAIGTPLLKGRAFGNQDTASSPPVAIVNIAFEKEFFSADALGKHFNIGQSSNGQFQFLPATVVGIAENVRHNGLLEKVQPEFYVPMGQRPPEEVDLVLRTSAGQASLSNAMHAAVTAVDHQQPLFDVQTMEERLSNLVAPRKLMMSLIASFAVLAVILAAVGVFGVFTYTVSQRTQEMGIRLALGATRNSLLRLIVLQAARLISFGGAIGIGAGWFLSRLLASTLVGITPHDTLSFSLAWVFMTLIALVASVVPAVSAARTDLLSVLRQE
ncbi:ABC transporter permease [Occallatibacter riparius]|uniref:ABC transporter permease n=1 Tax=Occallatibacter riparius TaxID=1002689 RepID=A0A9J7BJW0_9BACT|nr:ABC transporter permease [Occallatibacter riparius]UWZ83188.1 ABC transporter permease [Occallatibacter riparius]